MNRTFKGSYKSNFLIDLSNNDYHEHDSVSKSILDRINIAPNRVLFHKQKYIDAFRIGSAFHAFILEPEKDLVKIAPEALRNNKDGKQIWYDFFKSCGSQSDYSELKVSDWPELFERETNCNYITPQELKQFEYMKENIYKNELASNLLGLEGVSESSLFWTDPLTKLTCRCRPDFLSKDNLTVVDLKTIQTADMKSFMKSSYFRRYHVQAAMYMRGVFEVTGELPDFYFIASEKEFPYSSAVYKFGPETIQTGNYIYRNNLDLLANCVETNDWPSYPNNLKLEL